jgi:hypothetical protein
MVDERRRRNVRSPLVRNVVASQVAFFFFLGVCVAIEPTYLLSRNEGGLSNFGVHGATIVPYSLAFLVSALLVARTASLVDIIDGHTQRFRTLLLTLAGLLVLVLASTYGYKASELLHTVHIGVGVVMLCFESIASVWLTIAIARDPMSMCALAAQLIGFVLAALTFFGVLHVLFIAQLVTSFAFGVLLIRSTQLVAGGWRRRVETPGSAVSDRQRPSGDAVDS